MKRCGLHEDPAAAARTDKKVQMSTCSETSAGAPECCSSASCGGTERSLPGRLPGPGAGPPATQVSREPEPRSPPTAAAVASASSDSWLRQFKLPPAAALKVAPGPVWPLAPCGSCSVWPLAPCGSSSAPPHCGKRRFEAETGAAICPQSGANPDVEA